MLFVYDLNVVDRRNAISATPLADAGPRGSTLDILIAKSFPVEMLGDLVRDGLPCAR
jgi:hypothetical protein